jgi:DNA-binding SARP family transcriptional activator/tetratricopeptide (TPR) repeat protein
VRSTREAKSDGSGTEVDAPRAASYVRVLGPIGFVTDDKVVPIPSWPQRRLLAVLALGGGHTQRTEQLRDALDLSAGSLRTTVSRLRARIGDDTIHTDTTGYRLTCPVDAAMFTEFVTSRRDHSDRLVTLDAALALWRGDALDEFCHEAWAVADAVRLDELRLLAIEDRAELLIARAQPGEAVAALTELVVGSPLRDRPRGLLIQALASSGRQAEALRAYQDYRTYLADATGTEPSLTVRTIERRVAAGREPRHHPAQLSVPGHLIDGVDLIGRQREIEVLESELVTARAGSMRRVLVAGEAGIGKTTLIAAFARTVLGYDGDAVAYGCCAEGAAVPLEPFVTILAALVEHAPEELLQAHGERCGGELLRVVPRLADRVWVPPPATADSATERHHLFEAAADLLRRVASTGSLTLIVDDLHWAEPTALLLLRHLSRSLADAPVFLIAGFRDTAPDSTAELRSALTDLERDGCRRCTLTGFDDSEMNRLLRAVANEHHAPAPDLLERLRKETAGNPLYASQLVQHLSESNLLSVTANELRLAGDMSLGEVPGNLLDVVWSRVHALGDTATELLRAAAVLGTDFGEDVLVQMTGLADSDIATALDLALGAGLLVDTGSSLRPLRFTHALVERALYAELLISARRRLHQLAARAIENSEVSPLPNSVVDLARHSERAGDLAGAQRWALAAGDYASGHLAPTEAAAWYERALTFASDRHAPEGERAELMVRLGEAQHCAGDPRTHDTLLGAAGLARRVGAHDVLIRAALANDRGFSRLGIADLDQLATLEAALHVVDPSDTNRYARLLACRSQELVHTPDHALRVASARHAIELVDASDDPTLLPQLISALVFGLWGPDTLDLRRQLVLAAVAAVASTDDPFLEFSTNRAAYYVAIESGDARAAAAGVATIRRIAAEVSQPRLRWICEVIEAFEATMQARFDDADAHTEKMFEIGSDIGEPDAFGLYAAQLFANRSFAGRYDEVIPLLDQAIATTPDSLPFRLAHAISCAMTGRDAEARLVLHEAAADKFAHLEVNWTWMTTVIGYAVLAIELEDVGAAAALYPLLEPFGNQVAFNGATSQGYVGAYLGKLASLLGHHDVADDHLHHALVLNRSFGWEYHEATTLVGLARSQQRRTGMLDASGHAWLEQAHNISSAHGIRTVADDISRLRALPESPSCSSSNTPPGASTSPASPSTRRPTR